MSQISLTASMRSNLLSLQNTASLMSTTQERLASGKKVNSAIDNPSSYYTAQSLNNRANDLSSLLDSMGQAISTIKAANEGIESITSFVEQAKAVANSAMEATTGAERSAYGKQFDQLVKQINAMAGDSAYKGVNLIGGTGTTLTVKFNESGGSDLAIASKDATAKGIKLVANDYVADSATDAEHTWAGTEQSITGAVAVTNGHPASEIPANTEKVLEVGTDYYLYKGPKVETSGTVDLSHAEKLTKVGDVYYRIAGSTDAITASITAAGTAIGNLRSMASEFGNNYSIVQTREEFTNNLINVLEEGADKLTLADMNEESANMLALQTRQQLAINSLSLASTAAQSVLKLF